MGVDGGRLVSLGAKVARPCSTCAGGEHESSTFWGCSFHNRVSLPSRMLAPPHRYGDAEKDKGIKTTPDARFFAISSELKEAFTNKDVPLVLQVCAVWRLGRELQGRSSCAPAWGFEGMF